MNRLTLKYELDLDFVLVAITSQLKDYVLCFKLNKQLNINFYKIEELIIENNSGEVFFSRYHYQIPETETDFYLLANKGDQGYLISEMKTVDYFIIIRNYISQDDTEQLIEGINKLPEVLVSIEVDPKRLKSKENLIF